MLFCHLSFFYCHKCVKYEDKNTHKKQFDEPPPPSSVQKSMEEVGADRIVCLKCCFSSVHQRLKISIQPGGQRNGGGLGKVPQAFRHRARHLCQLAANTDLPARLNRGREPTWTLKSLWQLVHSESLSQAGMQLNSTRPL